MAEKMKPFGRSDSGAMSGTNTDPVVGGSTRVVNINVCYRRLSGVLDCSPDVHDDRGEEINKEMISFSVRMHKRLLR